MVQRYGSREKVYADLIKKREAYDIATGQIKKTVEFVDSMSNTMMERQEIWKAFRHTISSNAKTNFAGTFFNFDATRVYETPWICWETSFGP